MSLLGNGEANRRPKKSLLDRTVLRDQIREYLVDAILAGEYKAGDRIVETRVAQQLGISQGAVREALRELEWMGFLVTQPFSGTYVRAHSTSDLLEIYPVRAVLEALGARLAASRITDVQVEELRHLVDEMVQVSQAGDERGMVERNYAFHQKIIETSGNETLLRAWSMFQFSYWTMITTAAMDSDLEALARRHYQVLEAVASHDPERAAQVMSEHILDLVERLNQSKVDSFTDLVSTESRP